MLAATRVSESAPQRESSATISRADILFWLGLVPATLGLFGMFVGLPAMFFEVLVPPGSEKVLGLPFGVVCFACGLVIAAASIPFVWPRAK